MTFDEWLETKGSEAGYIEDLDPIEAAWNAAKTDGAEELDRLRELLYEAMLIIDYLKVDMSIVERIRAALGDEE